MNLLYEYPPFIALRCARYGSCKEFYRECNQLGFFMVSFCVFTLPALKELGSMLVSACTIVCACVRSWML